LKQKHFRAMQKTLKNNLSSSPSRVAAPVQPLLPFSSPLSRDLTLSSAKASPPLSLQIYTSLSLLAHHKVVPPVSTDPLHYQPQQRRPHRRSSSPHMAEPGQHSLLHNEASLTDNNSESSTDDNNKANHSCHQQE
jgi:hypothetical protein